MTLIEKREDMKVVGIGTKARNVLRSIKRTSPDVVIMDFVLPDANGSQLIQDITNQWKNIRVIVLSLYNNPDFQEAAKRNGAFTYLVKGGSMEDFFSSIYAAYEDGRKSKF
ncbi:MAG: response regulator transcription factor [Candidatus Atribacteria bacterium]|nr:response regulator transcription factor [Candidatus Atribacteria bacterium]